MDAAAPTTRKHLEVAIALVFNARGELLICKRKVETVLGGYWEFPGGKCNPGETPADCATRETWEETRLIVQAQRPLATIEHEYPHAFVRLHPFLCRHVGGVVQALEVAEARWIAPADVGQYEFPAANTPLIALIARGEARLP